MREDLQQLEEQLFGHVNRVGSRVYVDGSYVGLADSWSVVRIARHAGGDGMDFWVGWRALGWHIDPSPQHSHLHKILTWDFDRAAETTILHTDQGRVITFEVLSTQEDTEAWQTVQRQKRLTPAVWEQALNDQMAAFRALADTW